MKPHRIQLSRKKGWRKPPNTVVVARPTKWGNVFRVDDTPYALRAIMSGNSFVCLTAAEAVARFRAHVAGRAPYWATAMFYSAQRELRGKNLACWCPLDQPCHADVLLELANKPL